MQGACEVRGLAGWGPPHVSTGLGTMLLGVSGSCEDREVTSLLEELPREPDSEKETWGADVAGWSGEGPLMGLVAGRSLAPLWGALKGQFHPPCPCGNKPRGVVGLAPCAQNG